MLINILKEKKNEHGDHKKKMNEGEMTKKKIYGTFSEHCNVLVLDYSI